jgi:hypothetical protein
MNRTSCLRALFTSVMLCIIAAGAIFGQKLQNPTFDTDVSSWTAASNAGLSWDPLDADASPVSGSARVTNSSTLAVDSQEPPNASVTSWGRTTTSSAQ